MSINKSRFFLTLVMQAQFLFCSKKHVKQLIGNGKTYSIICNAEFASRGCTLHSNNMFFFCCSSFQNWECRKKTATFCYVNNFPKHDRDKMWLCFENSFKQFGDTLGTFLGQCINNSPKMLISKSRFFVDNGIASTVFVL